jgi:hypothetical protein
MMQSIFNDNEYARRRYEEDRLWRQIEQQHELMRHLYTAPSYRVEFSSILPDDKGYMDGNVIYVPESQAYKFIFMNNHVNDKTVQFAISHAIQKVNRFIDNYKA